MSDDKTANFGQVELSRFHLDTLMTFEFEIENEMSTSIMSNFG